jgi:hypothetical protein
MATSISFPVSPAPVVGDTYTYGSVVYTWDGTRWHPPYSTGEITIPFDSIGVDELKPSLKNIGGPNTIGFAELKPEKKAVTQLGTGTDVDWSLGVMFEKVLTADTTLTISNPVEGSTIKLVITGDFSITWPAGINVKETAGYVGANNNVFTITCIDTIVPEYSVLFVPDPADQVYTSPTIINISTSPSGTVGYMPNIKAGDLLIITAGSTSTSSTTSHSNAGGFTLVNQQNVGNSSYEYSRTSVWKKIADGTETGNELISGTVSGTTLIQIKGYTGTIGVSTLASASSVTPWSSSVPAGNISGDLCLGVVSKYGGAGLSSTAVDWGLLYDSGNTFTAQLSPTTAAGTPLVWDGSSNYYSFSYIIIRLQ